MSLDTYLLLAIVFLLLPQGVWMWGGCVCDVLHRAMGVRWKPMLKRLGKVGGTGVVGTALVTLYSEIPEARGALHYLLTLAGGGGALAAFQKWRSRGAKDWVDTLLDTRREFDEAAKKYDAPLCRDCGQPVPERPPMGVPGNEICMSCYHKHAAEPKETTDDS